MQSINLFIYCTAMAYPNKQIITQLISRKEIHQQIFILGILI